MVDFSGMWVAVLFAKALATPVLVTNVEKESSDCLSVDSLESLIPGLARKQVAELLEHLVAQEPPNELLAELAEATGVDIEALAAMEKEEKAAAVEKMRGPRDASPF